MRTYLLDDDLIQLIFLENGLISNKLIEIIGKENDAAKGIISIENLKPDLLFLDIDLVTHNGLELYKDLNHKPILILATSSLEYALDGFDLDAVDYIVKPYTVERLNKAVNKAHNYFKTKNLQTESKPTELTGDFVYIKDANFLHKVFFNEVLYIEALGDFAEFYLQDGSKKIALVNLKNLELQLPSSLFLRVSRTSIVAINKVTALKTYSLLIKDIEIGIGKTFMNKVLETLVGDQIIKRNV